MQCSAVQCSEVQYSVVQCSAVHYSAVQCSAVQCSAAFRGHIPHVPIVPLPDGITDLPDLYFSTDFSLSADMAVGAATGRNKLHNWSSVKLYVVGQDICLVLK